MCFLVLSIFWSIKDNFNDCYQKSFFGLERIAVQGPNKIYDGMNTEIGRFAQDGVLLFTHDYSGFHRTTGYERIGDTIGLPDFMAYNATVFSNNILRRNEILEFKNKTFSEFNKFVSRNPNNKKIIVSSKKRSTWII